MSEIPRMIVGHYGFHPGAGEGIESLLRSHKATILKSCPACARKDALLRKARAALNNAYSRVTGGPSAVQEAIEAIDKELKEKP